MLNLGKFYSRMIIPRFLKCVPFIARLYKIPIHWNLSCFKNKSHPTVIQSILLLYSFHSHHVAYKFDTFSKTFLFGNFSFGAHELYFHVRKFRNYFVKWLFLCYYSEILCGCPFCWYLDWNEWVVHDYLSKHIHFISALSCLLFELFLLII